MTIHYEISMRELNQNFPQYIKNVESGDEIIVTRRGKPIARITPLSSEKKLTIDQLQARVRVLKLMTEGLNLKGEKYKREDLHDR